jgi:hypothetical protein
MKRVKMMLNRVTITLDTQNAAFDAGVEKEITRILRKLANDIEQGHEKTVLQDINGNKVGTVEYE